MKVRIPKPPKRGKTQNGIDYQELKSAFKELSRENNDLRHLYKKEKEQHLALRSALKEVLNLSDLAYDEKP